MIIYIYGPLAAKFVFTDNTAFKKTGRRISKGTCLHAFIFIKEKWLCAKMSAQ